MNYLDANFAAALHFNIRGQSELAERFVRRNSAPFLFSDLAELACRRAFLLRAGKVPSDNWNRLQAMIEAGIWRREPIEWMSLKAKATELIDRLGPTLKAGTLDTLHVAQALLSGCTRFLSFDNDSNARVLAASCRLKVFPELTAAERGRLRNPR